MRPRTAGRVGWVTFVVSASLTAGSVVLWSTSVPEPLGPDIFLFAAAFVTFPAVGALIISRHPRHRVGWLLLCMGAAGGGANLADAYARAVPALPGNDWAAWLGTWAFQLGLGLTPIVLLLFPDGHLPSRRWRWALGLIVAALSLVVVGNSLSSELSDYPGIANPLGLGVLDGTALEGGSAAFGLLLLGTLSAVIAMIVRFRGSRGIRRQQMKWLAFSATLLGAAWIGITVGFDAEGIAGVLLFAVFSLALLLLPVTIGVAILRYGLYDIDRVINKALVYGLLTALLGGAYAGIVFGLGGLVSDNGVVVAAGTLAVAAAFRPLRRRVQGFIDRRFYRSRYDAARTLEAFGAHLREEVDLQSLRAELVGVVHETMRPASASLWLREEAG